MSDRDYIGKRFGTRVCTSCVRANGRWYLTVLCDCGRAVTTDARSASRSGCMSCTRTTHGYARGQRTDTYKVWQSMVSRCTNPRHHAYADYGGRGISVCEKWRKFTGFLEDMGERQPETSIDRIDNAKGYFKENCRWATTKQQQRNKRSNRLVTINGETKCVMEWSESSGIPFRVLVHRVYRNWPTERLLSPVRVRPAARNQAGR